MRSVLLVLFNLLLLFTVQAQTLNVNKNRVIAHRGAWKTQGLPENSIAALNEAIKLGCYGAEFDVWMTMDGVLVVNHDDVFNSLKIEDTTFKELNNFKLSNGENLPTLEAYLKAGIKQNSTKLILELKPSRHGAERDKMVAKKAYEMVKALKADNWIEYISFSINTCKELKVLDFNAAVFYLNGNLSPKEIFYEGLSGIDYNLSVLKKNVDWIEETKKYNLISNVWTVNKEEDLIHFYNKGVDFITTNEPELALSIEKNLQ